MLLAANVRSQSDTSTKLLISHNIFCSMPYADFRVNVYEHADNQKTITQNSKRYFYAPVALLDPQSASCVFNDVTKQNEMRFRVVERQDSKSKCGTTRFKIKWLNI